MFSEDVFLPLLDF